MRRVFQERSLEAEWMDIEPLDLESTAHILSTLGKINAWLGGVRATLFHVENFSKRWKPGERIRFIDWGTGGADIPRALVEWGRARGFAFEVVGIDNNVPVIDYARKACRNYPEIRLIQSDFMEFPKSVEPFDYAISSLCLHHLRDSEIVGLLKKSHALARRGIIMNDLKRSLRAWIWIWILTRLAGAHPIVKSDGPLSVRRAFRVEELEKLAQQAELSYLKVRTHFGYRLTLAGEKKKWLVSGVRV